MRKTSLTLTLLLLIGCTPSYNTRYPKNYSNTTPTLEVYDLLNFGEQMSTLPAASRSEQCRLLLKQQNEYPSADLKLQLMVGRLLSDACGDIPKILDGLASIPAGNLADGIQKLVSVDREALKRMNSTSKKLAASERKQKSVETVLEQKPELKSATGSKKDESQLLRDKLEAIRAMEKQIDDNSEGN